MEKNMKRNVLVSLLILSFLAVIVASPVNIMAFGRPREYTVTITSDEIGTVKKDKVVMPIMYTDEGTWLGLSTKILMGCRSNNLDLQYVSCPVCYWPVKVVRLDENGNEIETEPNERMNKDITVKVLHEKNPKYWRTISVDTDEGGQLVGESSFEYCVINSDSWEDVLGQVSNLVETLPEYEFSSWEVTEGEKIVDIPEDKTEKVPFNQDVTFKAIHKKIEEPTEEPTPVIPEEEVESDRKNDEEPEFVAWIPKDRGQWMKKYAGEEEVQVTEERVEAKVEAVAAQNETVQQTLPVTGENNTLYQMVTTLMIFAAAVLVLRKFSK